MVAASVVLVSHAYPISFGKGTPEPLESVLGFSLGTLAVLTFFAISGYFISQSFSLKPNVVEFAVARIIRIYPGLLAVLLLTVLILGPAVTEIDLAAYFSDPETLLYVPRNLRLWPLHYELPGVFRDNPYPEVINGSLWTLAYEVACYAMVVIVGIFCQFNRLGRFSIFLFIYILLYAAAIPLVRNHPDHLSILRNVHLVTLPFVIGMALFQFRQFVSLRLSVVLGLIVAAFVSIDRPWFHEIFVLSWSYGVLYLGFLNCKPLLLYNRLGDYSYGMYIYAFPVEQIVATVFRDCTPIVMMALALPLTVLLAILSWHLLERRALSQKSTISAWLIPTRRLANSSSSG